MKRNVEQKQTAMKRILLPALFIMAMLCRLQAQNTETHVTLHAGENALETLLTEEQKQSLKHLTVTGTLLDEDYAFLRGGLLELLDTLDLRDAEIDTIPAGALGAMELYLVLPKMIECIGDYAFKGVCEVTGNFPFLGICEYENTKPKFIITQNHPELFYVQNETTSLICSKDKETVFYFTYKAPMFADKELVIPDGTKIIGSSAYRGEHLYLENNIVLPKSLDSVGSYAFSNIFPEIKTEYAINKMYPNGCEYNIGSVICEAKTPPAFAKIGDGNFIGDFCNLYVPEESIEKYKTANGWKRFRDIKSLERLKGSSVSFSSAKSCVIISELPESYIMEFPRRVKDMALFDIQGRKFLCCSAIDVKFSIKKNLLLLPYTIAHIKYADGTNETVKLIP